MEVDSKWNLEQKDTQFILEKEITFIQEIYVLFVDLKMVQRTYGKVMGDTSK